ncbi:carbohydrate sulfotransferase [Plakobranchus ocellatus]|uniref:Carbohydrate sulfotransferase n=1 Tax=Plakobranchus ocellatus TaxID=259542 RepID=A0AAV3Y750_9GAST|nr:carbohydrate sulfotransferase [Plakobranchus ocellatus]
MEAAKFRIPNMFEAYRPFSKEAEIQQRFALRRAHLQSVCSRSEYQVPDKGIIDSDFQFSWVAFRRLRWCRIAKVGTTYMKSKFFPQSELKLLNTNTPVQRTASKNFKSFFFVRDPYSRLISGYLDKVLTAPDRWLDIGRKVIKTQRQGATSEEIECGSDASFLEFVQYVLWAERTGKTRNIHFLPMHDLCAVCDRHYDFIGHIETMKEDLSFILNSAGVRSNLNQNITLDIYRRIKHIFQESRKTMKSCLGVWPMMKRVWWTFQVRGYIADTIPLPASRQEVEIASWEKLASWIERARLQTLSLGSRSAQKRTFMVNMFKQVPLNIRLQFAATYTRDFQLFQYDPLPADLFPEYSNSTGRSNNHFET